GATRMRPGGERMRGPITRAQPLADIAKPGVEKNGRGLYKIPMPRLLIAERAGLSDESVHPQVTHFQPLLFSSRIPLSISATGLLTRMISRTSLSVLPVASIAAPKPLKFMTPVP